MRSYSIFLVRLIVIVLTVLIATPRLEAQQRTSSSADSTLSLQFKDIDVSEVFRMLSERSSLNIVAESGVSGRVTLFLEDVTPSEALDIIINLNNLAYVREGNVIMVFTDQKYQSVYGRKFRDQARMKVFRFGYAPVQQASTQLASLKTKDGFLIADNRTNSLIVFDVPTALKQYANAIEVLDIPVETRVYDLDHVSVGKIRELITPFVSSSAVVLADPAANRLIVRDAPAYLAVIDDIVPEWDTPSVIITQAFELNYAIAKDVVVRLTDRLTPEVGSVEVDANTNTLIVADLPDVLADIETFLRNLDRRPYEVRIEAKILQISLDDGFNMGVNWEAVTNEFQNVTDLTTTGQFRVLGEGDDRLTITGGKLEKNNYTALIEMLATQGRTRLLSSPTLMVLNNTAARILVGSTVPYKTVDTREEDGALRTFEKVIEVEVGVKLYVTPTISSDSMITMTIRPEVSSVTTYIDNIPVVEKSETETRVLVKDGVTVLIGGLVKQESRQKTQGVPLLSKIPLLGAFFRGTTTQKVNTELAILITPHIVSGDQAVTGYEEKTDPDKKGW